MSEKNSILVVEDEEVLRQMISRILASMKIICEIAEDSFIALEKMKEKEFDIVITDIRMPKMDGIELLGAIKKDYPGTDVLIMTALTSKYSFVDVIEAGATDYLTKPFSVEELKAKVERIQNERKIKAELLQKTKMLENAYAEINRLKEDSLLFQKREKGLGKD